MLAPFASRAPDRTTRRLLGGGCLLVLALVLALKPQGARAQENSQLDYFPSRTFNIPVSITSDPQQLQELRLWVWDGNTGRWMFHSRSLPDPNPARNRFDVRVDRDGLFIFAGQMVLRNGTVEPPVEQLQAMRRVVVDTEKPIITLKPLPVDPNGVSGLAWEVRDANLDVNSIRLDYRVPGQQVWAQLPLENNRLPLATDRAGWRLAPGQRYEVRLSVKDLAGNVAESVTVLGGSGTDLGTSGVGLPRPGSDAAFSAGSRPGMRYVKTRSIKLDFTIDDIGPSGLDGKEPVTLYVFTPKDRRWAPVAQKTPPRLEDLTTGTAKSTKAHVVYEAPGEGVFGFTMVARTGVGIAGAPEPRSGEEPNYWVEVDETPPQVDSVDVQLSQNPGIRAVTIRWRASDKNLGPNPISLDWSLTNPSQNWTPIEGATGLANSGLFTWSVPEAGPHKFYVRVRATDLAQNVGESVSKLVIVDMSRPRVNITNAEANGTGGSLTSPRQ